MALRTFRKAVAALSVVALVATMFAAPVAKAGSVYSDVNGSDWFAPYVEALANAGVFAKTNTSFRPGDNMTRAEFVKTLVTAAGLSTSNVTDPNFSDVSSSEWYFAPVAAAVANGVINGSAVSGTFRPNDTVTRGEAVKIALGAFGIKAADYAKKAAPFKDMSGNWAADYATAAYNLSIVDGVNGSSDTFAPNTPITRSAVAKIAAYSLIVAESPSTYARFEDGTSAFKSYQAADVVAEVAKILPTVTTTPDTTGTGTTTTVPTSDGTLEVSVASASPAATTYAYGTAYNNFLAMDLTASKDGDVTVTGIRVSRGSLSANTTIGGVAIWDATGKRHGNVVTSLTSDGQALVSFTSDPITVKAGTTQTVSVRVNIKGTDDSGNALTNAATMSFGVKASTDVVSNAKQIAGNFPMTGATMSVVAGSSNVGSFNFKSAGSTTVGGATQTAGTASTRDLNLTSQEVMHFQVTTNSNEAVDLKGITFYLNGNVADGDLANFTLKAADGTLIGKTAASSGKYVRIAAETPYNIAKGVTRDFYVYLDVVNGSGRFYSLQIQNDYDVEVQGSTTKSYLLPTLNSATFTNNFSSTNPWFQVNSGTLSITKATASPSGNVGAGATNVVIGEWDVKAAGEDMEIRTMSGGITVAAGASYGVAGTMRLVDDKGTEYYSASASTSGAVVPQARSLSTYVQIKANETKKLRLVVDTASDTPASSTYLATFQITSYKRISTNDFVTTATPTTAVNANTLTTVGTGLTISANTGYGNTNVAPNTNGAKVASFTLQATAAEDVRVNSFTVALNDSGSTALTTVSKLSNLMIKVGTTQYGTTVVSPSTSNSVSVSGLTVPKSSSVVVDIYVDQTSGVADMKVNLDASVVGARSGQSVDPTAANGQVITFATATLTITGDSQPSSQVITSGQTGVTVGAFRMEAKNSTIVLTKATLAVASTVGSGSTVFSKLYLYDGATKIGEANLTSINANLTGATAIFDGMNVSVDPNANSGVKTFTVKADISPSGTLAPGTVATVAITSTSSSDFEARSNGALITPTLSSASTNGMLYEDSAVTVAFATISTSQTPDTASRVGMFTVTNSGTREITLANIDAKVTVSGMATTGSSSGSVGVAKLYVDGSASSLGTLIETSTGTNVLTTNGTSTIGFGSSMTSTGSALSNGGVVAVKIAAGQSRTFVVTLDTSSIRSGITTGNAYVSMKLDGATGTTASTQTTGTNAVSFSYTPVNAASARTGVKASNSFPATSSAVQF